MILLGLLFGLYMAVWKRASKGDSSKNIVKHSVGGSPNDALNYWTADKMRKAKPAEMPHVQTPGQEKRRPQDPPHTSHPHQS